MKIALLIIALLLAVPCMAQVPIPLEWGASITPSEPDNPVIYNLYKCSDVSLTNCEKVEVGQALQFIGFTQVHAEQAHYYATAQNCDITSESSDEPGVIVCKQYQESAPSNTLRVRVTAPPGNPGNIKIRSESTASIRGDSVIDRAWNYADPDR